MNNSDTNGFDIMG